MTQYHFVFDTIADPTTLVREVLVENPPDSVGNEWCVDTNALVLARTGVTYRWFVVRGPFTTEYHKLEYIVREEVQPEIFLARELMDLDKRLKALRGKRRSTSRMIRRTLRIQEVAQCQQDASL
jgi:hypothetical protein